MECKVIQTPDRKITQTVLSFQFRFMGFMPEDLKCQDERYGSLPFGYVIGYEGEEIVAVINCHCRNIMFRGSDLMLGGIGGVCTHTEFRRRGISTRLLQLGMGMLREKSCEIAFLNADIKRHAALYGKVGFVPLKRKYKATGISGRVYLESSGMIAPVCSEKLFGEVLRDTEVFDLQGQDW